MNFMMTQPVRSVPALLQEEFIRTGEVIVEAENREGARRPMHNIEYGWTAPRADPRAGAGGAPGGRTPGHNGL